MAKRQTAAAIAEWAEKQATPTHKRKVKRLTQIEVGLLLNMHKAGKTQTEIAQALGVTQSAISRWLENTTDSTDIAKSYLRGSALRMAQNIVHKGAAKDHVAALKGLSVLQEEQHHGLTVMIGIRDSDISLTLSPPQLQVTSESLRKD